MIMCNFLAPPVPLLPSLNKMGVGVCMMGFCILKGAETLPGLTLPIGGVVGRGGPSVHHLARPRWSPGHGGWASRRLPLSGLHETGKFIISPTGFASEIQINFPSLPLSQASQSFNTGKVK